MTLLFSLVSYHPTHIKNQLMNLFIRRWLILWCISETNLSSCIYTFVFIIEILDHIIKLNEIYDIVYCSTVKKNKKNCA